MAPHLRILAGPSVDELVPITDIVNTSGSHKLSSDAFEGEISVHIKDFTDEWGQLRHSDYFERKDRHGVTWSIQVSGRFLKAYNADDILFGNVFYKRLKLPPGSEVAIGVMQFIDPTLEHDLRSETKPWALSPLITTMPHFSYRPPIVGDEDGEDSDTTSSSGMSRVSLNGLDEESSLWPKTIFGSKKRKARIPSEHLQFDTASQRKSYFRDSGRRKQVELGPHDLVSMDFCHGYLEFHPSLALRLGGLSFDLLRYWDKHPVRFVCCQRKKGEEGGEGDDPWGRVFWCVMIEICGEGL